MSLKKNNFYQKYFSELALSLARINKFITKENPSVGCVVTDFNNNILSSGVTSKNGRPHAENNALIKLNKKITKKIFVTLEPCNHYGKTPPCTKKIVISNVKQLHCNQIDKNPAVNGSGLKFLKENKIKIKESNINKNFYINYNYSVKNKLPYVTAKLAITKNFSTVVSRKKYFTNSQSLKFAHLLRYMNDSILVGQKTLLKDYPKLNCRIEGLGEHSPKIFFINRNLNFTKRHLLLYPRSTVVFHSSEDSKKISKYKKFFFLEKIESNSANFSPEEILKRIYKHKCRRLLIEGGSKTVNIFVKNKYVNKFFFIQSEINSKTKDPHTVNMVRSLCGNNFDRYNVKINLNNNKLFKI